MNYNKNNAEKNAEMNSKCKKLKKYCGFTIYIYII